MTSSHKYVLLQVAAKLVAAAMLLMIARVSGATAAGDYVFAVVLSAATAVVLELGGAKMALRSTSADQAWHGVLGPRLRICTAIAVAGPVAAILLQSAPRTQLLCLGAGTGGLLALSAIADGALLGRGAGAAAAVGNLIFNVVGVLLVVVVLIASPNGVANWLVVTYFISAAATTLYYDMWLRARTGMPLLTLRLHPRRQGDLAGSHERQYSRITGLSSVLSLLYFRMDVLLLGALAERAELAIYAFAYRLIEVAIVGLQLVGSARQPAVARAQNVPDRQDVCNATYLIIMLLAGGTASLTALIGPHALTAALGPAYVQSGRLAVLLAPGVIGLGLQIATALYIAGSTDLLAHWRWLISISIMNVAVGSLASVVGYLLAGMPGLAVGQSSAELVLGCVIVVVVLRRLHLRVPRVCFVMVGAASAILVLAAIGAAQGPVLVLAMLACIAYAGSRKQLLQHTVGAW